MENNSYRDVVPLRISLTLLGEFDPDIITESIKLKPSSIRRRSDAHHLGHKVLKDSWSISRNYTDHHSADTYIYAFLEEIGHLSNSLADLKRHMYIEGVLNCVVSLETGGASPAIYLSEQAIARLRDLGIAFNVSLYFD